MSFFKRPVTLTLDGTLSDRVYYDRRDPPFFIRSSSALQFKVLFYENYVCYVFNIYGDCYVFKWTVMSLIFTGEIY